ncbi:DNA topoisomerase IB [Candidatus Gracilibacteria bacterium]|nr:DNA topoisomerase IB [Candidatus Gracilibacteria bacterium]
MVEKIEILKNLYTDYEACASKFGLKYCEDTSDWIVRKRAGKGFYYKDTHKNKIDDSKVLTYIKDLVIPPKWEETFISPDPKNHMLAIGFDEKGRKQYIYNEDWSHARNLIKSYKMILFGNTLRDIRKQAGTDIKSKNYSFEKVMATLLTVLDDTVIRIGDNYYYEENETVGLTTMHQCHLDIKTGVAQLEFQGKSGKEHTIKIKKKKIVTALTALKNHKQENLFSYKQDGEWHELDATKVNCYLHEYGSDLISAKDFRTWHATRIVFKKLIAETQKKDFKKLSDTKRNKILLESFDLAAHKLGNTRTVIKNSYVHGDMADTFRDKKFSDFFHEIESTRKKKYLSKTESQLLAFLEFLFQENFAL